MPSFNLNKNQRFFDRFKTYIVLAFVAGFIFLTYQLVTAQPLAEETNNLLSSLRVESSDSTTGPFVEESLGANFSPNLIYYYVSLDADTEYIKVTPTKAETTASLEVGKVVSGTPDLSSITSGTTSAAISIDHGKTTVIVKVTAANGWERIYDITVNRESPAVPLTPNLELRAADTSIEVNLSPKYQGDQEPDITSHTIEYKTADATSWTTDSTAMPSPYNPIHQQTLTGLTNDTEYNVRVKYTNSDGDSGWTTASATPRVLPTSFTLEAASQMNLQENGVAKRINGTLNSPAPRDLRFGAYAVNSSQDVKVTSGIIEAGQTNFSFTVTAVIDNIAENEETITIKVQVDTDENGYDDSDPSNTIDVTIFASSSAIQMLFNSDTVNLHEKTAKTANVDISLTNFGSQHPHGMWVKVSLEGTATPRTLSDVGGYGGGIIDGWDYYMTPSGTVHTENGNVVQTILHFTPSKTSHRITFTVREDSLVEPNETIIIRAVDVNSDLTTMPMTLTIEDYQPPASTESATTIVRSIESNPDVDSQPEREESNQEEEPVIIEHNQPTVTALEHAPQQTETAPDHSLIIAKIKTCRSYAQSSTFTNSWNQALKSFGELTVNSQGLTALTASEAQAIADQLGSCWSDIIAELEALEASQATD